MTLTARRIIRDLKRIDAMARPPQRTALSEAELRHEQEAQTACWKYLQPLDSRARFRVLEWLGSWARAETPFDDPF